MENRETEKKFLAAQSLAYEAVKTIAGIMEEGWTEIQAAQMIQTYLQDHGVKAFFHEPFAWFGDRTRFDGVHRKRYRDFNPTHRRLKEDDIVILDVAPILNGAIGDIGYTFSLSENQQLERAKKFLKKLRDLIPKLFDKKLSAGEVWKKIDAEISGNGYDNIHQIYPFHVLGHRVRLVPFSGFSLRTPLRFSLHSFYSGLRHGLWPELLTASHHGNTEGLWAIEPHIGASGFGAKFEEILVIDKDSARWLSEKAPWLT